MRKLQLAAAGMFLSALSGGASAADVPGYLPQDQQAVAPLPIHVVFGPAKVRPEIAYGWVSIPYPTTNYATPGMSVGQNIGINVAGGMIASLIINSAEKSEAKHAAKAPYAVMTGAGCDLDLDKTIGNAARTAINDAWPGASVQMHVTPTPQSPGKLLDENAPRYVFQVSTSLATDFSALITSIDADAYPQAADSTHAVRKPAWHDSLILVSDRINFPDKTQADIDRMVTEENARYAALNLGPVIKMLNADVDSGDLYAHREERKRLSGQMDEHSMQLKLARSKAWAPESLAMQRAHTLSDNSCSGMHAAIAQSSTLVSEAIAALAHGTLPPRLSSKEKSSSVEEPGQRAMIAIPGGLFLSRRGGDDLPLGFRYSILPQ